jgi:hypothetical protein
MPGKKDINIVFVRNFDVFEKHEEIEPLMSAFKTSLTGQFPDCNFNVTFQRAYAGITARANLKFVLQAANTKQSTVQQVWEKDPKRFPIDGVFGIGPIFSGINDGRDDFQFSPAEAGAIRKLDLTSDKTQRGLKKLFASVKAYIHPEVAPAPVYVQLPATPKRAATTGENPLAQKIARDLLAYAFTPTTAFTFAPKSRTLNSKINRKLASDLSGMLMRCSDKAIGALLQKDNVQAMHDIIKKQYSSDPDFANRGINSKALNAILDEGREQYKQSFAGRKALVKQVFQAYLERVETDPSQGFLFFKESRTESRRMNIELVKRLRACMAGADTNEAEFANIFTKEKVENIRLELSKSFNGRGLNSAEVNAALKLARKLFPAQPEAPVPTGVSMKA